MKNFYNLLIVSIVFFSVSGYCNNFKLSVDTVSDPAISTAPTVTPSVPEKSSSIKQEQKFGSLTRPCSPSFYAPTFSSRPLKHISINGRRGQLTAPEGTHFHQLFSQWVMGYYVGYQVDDYPIDSIDWTSLTHIIFSPMTVNTDMTLNFDFNDEPIRGEQNAIKLAQAAHAHCVKALLMLGGAKAGKNIADATSKNLPAFVNNLLATMDRLGYDGIDLDWEDSVNFPNLIALAKNLREVQNARHKEIILTYPAFPYNRNWHPIDDSYFVKLSTYLDRFNVQTYIPAAAGAGKDEQGADSGWDSWFVAALSGDTPATPVSIEDSLNHFASLGIPRYMLGMGTAFFAVCYTNGISAPHQNANESEIVGGDNQYPLSKFYAAGSIYATSNKESEVKFDAAAAEPYLTFSSPRRDPNCNANTQYISYENEDSLKAKGAFSKKNGYGGIIIWTIQQGWLPVNSAEGRKPNALMQALKKGFIDLP